MELAIEQEFPSVVIGKSLSPFISFVDNNNEKAGFDATEYMIKEGCSSIALISGRHQLFVSQDRLIGYKKALEHYAIPIKEGLISHVGEFTRERGYQTMKSIIERETIDGVVTTDALITEGALRYLNENQISVPVLTFDSNPPLLPMTAYVNIHTLELGRSAFQMLLKVIDSYNNKQMMCYRTFVEHSIIRL